MRTYILFLLLILTQTLFAQTFTGGARVTLFDGVGNSSVAFADIDGDGDQDALLTGQNGLAVPISKLFDNDGSGNFTEITGTPFEGVQEGSVAFADVDGDGDDDVLISGFNSLQVPISKLYLNQGAGTFTEATSTLFEGVGFASIAFADIDGDNDQDVLITGINSADVRSSKLYTNDGSGSFIEVTGTPFEGVSDGSIAFADVNGDNDQDVVITGQNSPGGQISKLYINDGAGTFSESTSASFEGVTSSSISFADVDGDNDQDLLITGGGVGLQQAYARLYLNDGIGIFAEQMTPLIEGVTSSSVTFLDVEGDNDQDLVVSGLSTSDEFITKLYVNDGTGTFSETMNTSFESVASGSTAFADVDGDSDLDVIITGFNRAGARTSKLYLNDGNGNYSGVNPRLFEGVAESSIAFADVDGDNDQDLLLTGRNNSRERIAILYTNDGTGNLTQTTASTFAGVSESSVAFADVDGDNDQDVLITGATTNSDRIAKLYINGGQGNFTEVFNIPFTGVYNSAIAFADVDGDNDQDVLITGVAFVSDEILSELYINDGSGNFTLKRDTPFEAVAYSSVAFADIDGDDDQDVLITGVSGTTFMPVSKLYTNDGTGTYTEVVGTSFINVNNGTAVFADVDGDNDQDVIISGRARSNMAVSKLYINDGVGNFIEKVGVPFDDLIDSAVAFADIDGDSDLDLLLTGRTRADLSRAELYINDGLGNFSRLINTPFEGVYTGSVAFADIDGDTDQDIFITGKNSSLVRSSELYINESVSSVGGQVIFDIPILPFPNPTNGAYINVGYYSPDNAILSVQLFDLKGAVVSQQKVVVASGQESFVVDLKTLSTGTYIIQVDTGKGKGAAKFVVE